MRMRKQQFRIGHLAEKLGVDDFVIRFWEKEFKLPTHRSQGGQRFYTLEDLAYFKQIQELLHQKGFTIAGAKRELKQSTTISAQNLSISCVDSPDQKDLIEKCRVLKKKLLSLKEVL